jgi:predicted transcriptional regulator
MTGNKLQFLSWFVERYDAAEQPVTPIEAADHFGIDVETARTCFDEFESNDLLATVGDRGYRPTVTARELLELDVDDTEFLVLDACRREE